MACVGGEATQATQSKAKQEAHTLALGRRAQAQASGQQLPIDGGRRSILQTMAMPSSIMSMYL